MSILRFSPKTDAAAAAAEPELESFAALQDRISPEIYKALVDRPFRFSKPSSVQSAVLSMLPGLASSADASTAPGPDLLVKARTGTGKTVAFTVPALEHRLRSLAATGSDGRTQFDRRGATTVGCLILSPTRELASQIAVEAVKMCTHTRLEVQLFVGGASKSVQLRQWQRGRSDVIVATPGRMLDLLNSVPAFRSAIATTKTLVLDEADTLLDMGFSRELDQIIAMLPKGDGRQTFMFSATVPPEVARIARSALRPGAKVIDTVPSGETTSTHEHVPQFVTVVPEPRDYLLHLTRLLAADALAHPDGAKTIVFCATTAMTSFVARLLRHRDVQGCLPWGAKTHVFELSSRLSQGARDGAADRFRRASGGHAILVTSDVSARGVDYPGVTRVIQLGLPRTADVYVHRIGRTGRAGKSGRGDLVLWPFEAHWLDNELRHLPLKPFTVRDAQSELEDALKAHDAQAGPPMPPPRAMRGSRHEIGTLVERGALPGGLAPQFENISDQLEPKRIDADFGEEVESTFSSLCGYYTGIFTSHLGEVVKTLEAFAMEACGALYPPRVPSTVQAAMDGRSRRPARDGPMARRRAAGTGGTYSRGGHSSPASGSYGRPSYGGREEGSGGRGSGRDSRPSFGDRDRGSRSSFGRDDRSSSVRQTI